MYLAVCAAVLAAAMALADEPLVVPAPDLIEGIPAEFPRLRLGDHERESSLLSRYLWDRFEVRRPTDAEQTVLFNKEYLAISDLWLGGAKARAGKPIQRAFGDSLLAIKLDPDGYVHTHQHFSHAHDHGWPFPLWTQVPGGPAGVTAGWHFQEDGPAWMWVWGYLKGWNDPRYFGLTATKGWGLHNLRSEGLVDGKWRLEATGESPALTTPEGMEIDALNAPFLQLRWKRSGEPKGEAYIEWLREGDADFGPDRRMPILRANSDFEGVTGVMHCITPMHEHPKWQGKISRVRLALAPGESDVVFDIDSFFTVYDTRHSINNPIYILACWRYVRWTGDIDFLRTVIDRLRAALRYQQTVMGGLEHKHIRNPWVGHDGRPGYTVNADGSKTFHPGHGIGNNYWDLLPFGGDDMYATSQYYASTLAMAGLEEAIDRHSEWGIARGEEWAAPKFLRRHAADVKRDANRRFWNEETGRFVGWIDLDGVAYDYGFTFVNLEAIWYGIASERHAREIMRWIRGERIVEGDTSTGADIYRWRFGPRATTKRNVEAYGQGWTAPESLPWGGQVQDGGAVLGFTFFDLWARLHTRGADDVWQRLSEILQWEDEARAAGGYREFYKDGKQGTTLQGGGTAGGIGIDCEFYESSLLPAIVVEGLLGIEPTADALLIRPRLPKACPAIGVTNLSYRGVRLDVLADGNAVSVAVKEEPAAPIRVRAGERAVKLARPGVYRFGAEARVD
jgi:hypothetical protein